MARLVRPTVLKRDDYAADIERIGYSGIDCEEIPPGDPPPQPGNRWDFRGKATASMSSTTSYRPPRGWLRAGKYLLPVGMRSPGWLPTAAAAQQVPIAQLADRASGKRSLSDRGRCGNCRASFRLVAILQDSTKCGRYRARSFRPRSSVRSLAGRRLAGSAASSARLGRRSARPASISTAKCRRRRFP